MAIDFSKTFGAGAATATSSNQSKPKAQFWINIGVLTEHKDDNGEQRFVSLATGIALDTMETLPTNSKNVMFGQFQAARNDLRDQLVAAASTLKPGEAAYINAESGLKIQIRRVSEEVNAVAGEGNPFRVKLGLVSDSTAAAV
jgi:hypothetical protein